jgi:hypothetical protein
MRRNARVAGWLLLVVLGGAAPSMAQVQDTVGVVDTLAFASGEAAQGGVVAVAVQVANDFPCQSLTIPVGYPTATLLADSVTFAGGRAAHFPFLTATIDNLTGRIVISEVQFGGAPLPPGFGTVAWIHFRVNASALPGALVFIDTAYVNDQGKLLFLGGHSGMEPYLPAVLPGQLTIVTANHPPAFLMAGAHAVREGDSISFSVTAGDLDGDPVRLNLMSPAPGMVFESTGSLSGVFRWRAPFVGPYSAAGGTQRLRFVADDGESATTLELPLQVVNVNRPPVIQVRDTLTCAAFDSVHWQATATDPDLDFVSITLAGLPSGASLAPGNPAQVEWRPLQADTGSYPIHLVADDGFGGRTSVTSVLRIAPGDRVAYLLDTIAGYSDQDVVLQIHMKNQELLAGVELLVNIDPTAASITSIDRAGTRIENWEMFATTQNYAGRPGDVFVLARADVNDGFPTPLLQPGDGALVNIRLHLSADELFAGLAFPVRFVFRTPLANTATDAQDETILQNEIAYRHGEVQILKFDNKLPGDINLNGLAYEVGDVVYFANYFSNPSLYPLNYEQRANSDVNGDGTPATIADLVFMIKVISGGGSPKITPSAGNPCWWSINAAGDLEIAALEPLGGIHVVLEPAPGTSPGPGPGVSGLTVKSGYDGRIWRFVAYPESGAAVAPGAGPILEGLAGARVISIEASDVSGGSVPVLASSQRPKSATLQGNYPNPFNPETAIRFALSAPGVVTIEVYNLLGLRVRVLEGSFPAGEGELVWDGMDSSGRAASSGVYFYKLASEGTHQVRRMLLLK